MKKFTAGFVFSVIALSSVSQAATSSDPEQIWEHAEQREEQTRQTQAERERIAGLYYVKPQHIQEALQLAAQKTGEPTSAFTYKCEVPESGRPTCDPKQAVPFDYYRFIILQSRHKVCKYDAFGTPRGFFDSFSTGSIICHDY